MDYVRRLARRGELTAADYRALVLRPEILGENLMRDTFGFVEKVWARTHLRSGVHIHSVYCLMGFPDDAHRFHIANTRFKGAYANTRFKGARLGGWSARS